MVYEPENDDIDNNNNNNNDVESKSLDLVAIHERRDKQTEMALRQLTGQPFEQDRASFALPVCAPFSVLVSYKYRIKLTPGTQKRGKTVKDCANVLLKAPFASEHEKSAVREALGKKIEDCSRTLPQGGCKITLPPGAMKELQKAQKAAKLQRGLSKNTR